MRKVTMIAINHPSQPSNLLGQLISLSEQGHASAVLTLVNIDGSAPYPIGSQMLVSDAGQYWGQITGGCAESALAIQAQKAIASGHNQTHRYGKDSPFFDIQLPCGSGIDVHIDVSTEIEIYRTILADLAQRKSSILALNSEHGPFERRYFPCERIAIFGQGPVLISLLKLAQESGFETIAMVQDERDLFDAEAQGFKGSLLHEVDTEYAAYFDSYTAVVSLFHEHDREIPILDEALKTDVFYVGALGSRRTHSQRLSALQELGWNEALLDKIHGPIGLDIGAESPAQIAVSILSEIVAKMPKTRSFYG